ncbi:MAG: amino acid adenylation domain-containing protein [Proteobacteria bacterium]|nr:amino acid adenylation domain-containing protein [Pseudomonadota bacterium]
MPDNLQLPVDWLVAPAGSAKSADADVSLADTRIDAAPADIGYAALAALLLQLSRYGNTNPSTLAFVERAGDTTQAMVSIDCTAASASSARQLLAVMRESLQQPTPADRVTDTRASIHITHAGSHDQALRLAHESVARGATQLRFVVSFHSGSLRATLVYDAGAFSAATAQRLASHFGALWQGLLSQPEAIAQNLQMLDAAEQDFIRDAGTAPEPATAHPDALALVDAAMARSPDGLAAIHNERRVTYLELGRLADGLGLRLRAVGVSAGDRVAVCLDPCVESLACILALLRMRAVYVPIDPGYPAARVSLMLQDCAARVIITSSRRQDALREQAASLLVIDAAAVPTAPAESAPTGTPAAEDSAYIFYTSGTTGAPKGVLANRGNLAHYVGVARARYDLTASDVMVCIARASFSISLFELLTPLTVGGTCVILDREQVLDFSRLAHALQHVSVIHAGPSLLRGLIAHVDASAPGTYDYSRMRHASSGGDLVPPEVLEGLRRIFRKAEIFVIYGCSEISVMGCTYEAPRQGQIDRTYVGAPFPGVRYRVLDEQRRPVPLGVSGEVYFSGPGVIAGYLNRAELTAERFCQIDGRRFYNTGDVGRICANGQLQLLGRLDFQVQIRGMRVELGEIEHALRRMPELRDAVVSARPDRSGEMALVAYYVPRDGIQITTAQLRKALQAVLPDYMVPGIYCALDALPLNANMKVDRKALPDPATVRRASDADAQAPQLTATEETIAAIWRELLGIDVVRPQDDFFDIGGHSLTAMRVMTQLQSRAGVNLPASAIFQHGTLSALAQTVETQLATGGNRGEALQAFSRKAGELLPLSAAQERMWFWSEMAPDVALYNVPIMVKIEGALDEQRLQVALDAVMRRHEILRRRWRITDGTPQQVVDAQACWPLRIARSSGASTTAARDDAWRWPKPNRFRPSTRHANCPYARC